MKFHRHYSGDEAIMHHHRVAAAFAFCAFIASISVPHAQEALPVSVELGDVSLTKLPFIVAAEAGIYERDGLKVSQFISPRAAELIRQSSGVVVPKEFIHTGLSDINIGGGSPTIVRMTTDARAPHRIILATTEDILRFHVITRGDITRVEDLRGKRIGFSSIGALSHLGFMQLAQKMGWDAKADLSMFANGAGPKELKANKVDAYAADVIAFDEAKKAGLYDLVDLASYKFPMPGSGVNADVDWLPTHRETAARFIKATIEAVAVLKTDKDVTFKAMAKWYGITDRERQESIYKEVAGLPSKPYPSVAGLQKMIEIYDWREMRRHKPQDFFDASFVTELDKIGYIDSLYAKAKS
jgi:ABC-type nitrate/sulfonate/bicarbonate transport system substrate-binding protein